MGLIEDNSDRIAHLILDEAHLEFSGLTITTANAWKPEQSGNSSGRPGGTYDLVRYVVETAEGGKLFMLWYSSPGVSYPTYRCRKAPGQGRTSRRGHLTKLRAIEMLLDRGSGESPQQLDIPQGVSNRPLEHICLMGYCGRW